MLSKWQVGQLRLKDGAAAACAELGHNSVTNASLAVSANTERTETESQLDSPAFSVPRPNHQRFKRPD